MRQFKHLITSGCSFTDVRNNYNWPLHVGASYGDIDCNHVGLGCQGNGLIARKAVYAVHTALKNGVCPEEILVGIMWSGPDRHELYFKNLTHQLENTDHWIHNPTHVVEKDPGGWLIMNHHWTEKTNKIYYSHLHDFDHQRILTLEKILWVQNYLKNLGVRYFMTNFMGDNYIDHPDYRLNPNISWLEEQIDRSCWLPVDSMHTWTYNYWNDDDYPIITATLENGDIITMPDFHPQPEMHKRFVKEIVLPFIKEKFSDYYCPNFKEYTHHV